MAADFFGIGSDELAAISAAPITFFGSVALVAAFIWGIMRWRYGETINKLKERVEHRDEEIARLTKRNVEQETRARDAESLAKSFDKRLDELVDESIARDRQLLDLTAELQQARADLEAANSKSTAIRLVDPDTKPVPAPKASKPVPVHHMLEEAQKRLEPRRLFEGKWYSLVAKLMKLGGSKARISTAMNADDGALYAQDIHSAFAGGGWEVETKTLFEGPRSKFGLSLAVEDPQQLTDIQTAILAAFQEIGIEIDLAKGGVGTDVEIQIGVRQD